MSDAVLATTRPIFFSLCEWNGHTGTPFDWVRSLGNSWRTNGDIDPHWDSVLYEADHADTSDSVWQQLYVSLYVSLWTIDHAFLSPHAWMSHTWRRIACSVADSTFRHLSRFCNSSLAVSRKYCFRF